MPLSGPVSREVRQPRTGGSPRGSRGLNCRDVEDHAIEVHHKTQDVKVKRAKRQVQDGSVPPVIAAGRATGLGHVRRRPGGAGERPRQCRARPGCQRAGRSD